MPWEGTQRKQENTQLEAQQGSECLEPWSECPSPGDLHSEDKPLWLVGGTVGTNRGGPSEEPGLFSCEKCAHRLTWKKVNWNHGAGQLVSHDCISARPICAPSLAVWMLQVSLLTLQLHMALDLGLPFHSVSRFVCGTQGWPGPEWSLRGQLWPLLVLTQAVLRSNTELWW